MRKESVKKNIIVYTIEKEINKMITDTQITLKQKQKLKTSLMERRKAFTEDMHPVKQVFFELHKI